MGHAILPMTLQTLGSVFQLPGNYQIVACQYDITRRMINFLVESDDVPENVNGEKYPELSLIVTRESLLEHPGYHKYTVEPKILKAVPLNEVTI